MPKTIELHSDRAKIAARILELRTRRKMTQRQLAIAMNTHHSVITHWEAGRQMPSLVMAKRAAKALGITLDELMEGIE